MSLGENREEESDPFSQIRLICDGRFPHKVAQIMPGEYYVSQSPTVIYTVLGSFFSVCVNDPLKKVGGMNHFMAPDKTCGKQEAVTKAVALESRYAIDRLVERVIAQGGDKTRMEIKVFGGATLQEMDSPNSENRAEWVMAYLKEEALTLVKSDVGDIYPRKLYFYTDSGRVLMKKITRMRNQTILIREDRFRKKQIKEGISMAPRFG